MELPFIRKEVLIIGIDWSEKKHDAGAILGIVTLEHAVEGFEKFEAVRRDLGLAPDAIMVGLETAHNLLIDYLWAHAYNQVYVVPPSVVKRARKRSRQSRALVS